MPLDLIKRMVQFRVVENDQKAVAKKKTGYNNTAGSKNIGQWKSRFHEWVRLEIARQMAEQRERIRF